MREHALPEQHGNPSARSQRTAWPAAPRAPRVRTHAPTGAGVAGSGSRGKSADGVVATERDGIGTSGVGPRIRIACRSGVPHAASANGTSTDSMRAKVDGGASTGHANPAPRATRRPSSS